VLVGGGCGLLGSYLVPQLLEAGARVTVADSLSKATTSPPNPLAAVRFVRGDLRDPSFCREVMRGKEVVLNLPALVTGVGYSRAHPGEMLVSNVLAGLTPLEAARQAGVERYLVVSSSCVYPDDAPVPTPELPVFTREPERANEGYGWAKRVQELAGVYY